MYRPDMFPAYVLGSFYMIPATALDCLVSSTWSHGLVSVEDVYVTGILRQACNLQLYNVPNSSPEPVEMQDMSESHMIIMLSGNQTMINVHRSINKLEEVKGNELFNAKVIIERL